MRATLVALLGVATLAQPAVAQSVNGVAHCELGITPLYFGRYPQAGAAPIDSTATVTIDCSTASATPVTVQAKVDMTMNATVRQLRKGSHMLRYQLYADAARTVPWGDGMGGTIPLTATGVASRESPLHQRITVYGRIFAGQGGKSVGSFNDQVVVSLRY